MMSAEPAAVWNGGTVKVFAGSRKLALGSRHGAPLPSFWLVSGLEMTPPLSISEPVAARVSTVTRGRASSMGVVLSANQSHGSRSLTAAAQMNLEQSMVEPPPTASTTSTPASRQSSAPRRTEAMRGLGSMPPSSTTVIPCPRSWESTRSYSPVRLMDPPP